MEVVVLSFYRARVCVCMGGCVYTVGVCMGGWVCTHRGLKAYKKKYCHLIIIYFFQDKKDSKTNN